MSLVTFLQSKILPQLRQLATLRSSLADMESSCSPLLLARRPPPPPPPPAGLAGSRPPRLNKDSVASACCLEDDACRGRRFAQAGCELEGELTGAELGVCCV